MQENKFDYLKHPLVIIFSIFLGLFLFARFAPSFPISVLSQQKGEPFVISGEGKVTVAPDIAKVDFGIQQQGQTLKQVQGDVDKKSKSLVDALKKLGIAEGDIQTTSYSVYPQYDFTNASQKIIGYQVSINYEVTVKNFDILNSVFTTATDSGANTSGGINFDLSDSLKQQKLQEARDSAVKQAKTNAEGMAKSAGITLGKIINVSENQNQALRQFALPVTGGGVDTTTKAVVQPNVQPGQTVIDTTISLSYEVK